MLLRPDLILNATENVQADAQGRGVYAITTDAYRFYEAQGYTVLQEGFIGGDNPKWDGPPIGFRIVSSSYSSSSLRDSCGRCGAGISSTKSIT